MGPYLIGFHIAHDRIQVSRHTTDCGKAPGSVPHVFGTERSCLQVGTGRIEFKRRFLIEAVRSKKGFPFHSIILSLTGVKLGSVEGEVRKGGML